MPILAARFVLEFYNNLWGLGTEQKKGCRASPPEPVFVNDNGS
jgi:hypothetical protein